jgi:hypothetical protein
MRDNVFLPKKLIKLNEGIIRDTKMMNIEPAKAVKGNRRKLPYLPMAIKSAGVTLFRLNVVSTHTAVSMSRKPFRYGFTFS